MVLPKNGHFPIFFFRQYRPGKCLLRYSRTKKMPFQAINTRSSKSLKIDIFLKGLTHGFGPKLAIFPTFFLDNKDQENVYYDILKTRSSKSRKIVIFLKELTHAFGPKMAIFRTFFLANIWQENVFYDILKQKNAFLGYKNKKFKKSKIDIFLKWLTHGFGPKMAIFRTFFFRQDRPEKCLLRYSGTKKCVSRL